MKELFPCYPALLTYDKIVPRADGKMMPDL